MSASPGKFIDHYAILGVDPGVDEDGLQRAFDRMTERYGPLNIDYRDDEKYALIQEAYRVLSDPDQRDAFDAIKGVAGDQGRPTFSGMEFFDVLGHGVALRAALLCILYDRRRSRPTAPSLSMRHVESMLQAPLEALNFALWYLKQRGFVTNDEKSSLMITVEGMDFLEANRPNPDEVMPFIKLSALAGARKHAPKPASPQPEPYPAGAALAGSPGRG